jgi:glycogen synthase
MITGPISGQGFGYGTSVVVLRSPEILLAAVDRKEIYRDHREGKASVEERLSCKLTRAGPYFAIVSGLAHGTNGFDALIEVTQSYPRRNGHSRWVFATASAHPPPGSYS